MMNPSHGGTSFVFSFFRRFYLFRARLSARSRSSISWIACVVVGSTAAGQSVETVDVAAQPMAANVGRLLEALELAGAPLAMETVAAIRKAGEAGDAQ